MVQRDPSLLKSVKKNTLGTLFVFEVIRFQKKLLNLKEHPIPSLGLSVVLHRESFCFLANRPKNQMLASVIIVRARLQLSAYAFVLLFAYGRITPNTATRYRCASTPASLALRVCVFWPSTFSSFARLRRLYVIGLQRPPSSALDLCACIFSTYKRLYFIHNANNIPRSTN